MDVAKITISIDRELLIGLDRLVKSRGYKSRSQAVQAVLEEKIARQQKIRLAEQCAKLDPQEEQSLADTGLSSEAGQWPPY